MTARAASMPFPARLRTELQLDPVLLSLVLALLLGGFVILASASISISENAADNPFFYLQRQLLAAVIGGIGAATCLFIPMQVWRNLGPLMLLLGLALLVVVLVPGIGYEVNGARRWVRVGIMNLQERQRVKLFLRRDAFRRFFSCLVYVPREKYNTRVRQRIECGGLHGRPSSELVDREHCQSLVEPYGQLEVRRESVR